MFASQPAPHAHAGFSLIELLLVVAIIGILAGVVAIRIAPAQDGAREAATRASIAGIRTAIGAYTMTIGREPADLQELVKVGDADWPGPFLDTATVPRDGWGQEFKYEIVAKRARVTSPGKDGQFGTKDDLWK